VIGRERHTKACGPQYSGSNATKHRIVVENENSRRGVGSPPELVSEGVAFLFII